MVVRYLLINKLLNKLINYGENWKLKQSRKEKDLMKMKRKCLPTACLYFP